MPTITYPPQRPLSVGEILDLTFRIFRATVMRCLGFSVLGVIAGQLTSIYSIAKGRGVGGGWQGFLQAMQSAQGDSAFRLLYVLAIVLTLVFYAAVLLRQRALLGAGPVGGEIRAGLRRTPAMIGLFLLLLLTVGACLVPFALAKFAPRAGLILVVLILASYVFIALSCSFIVLLLEGAGPLESYKRSWQLTSGSFWRLSLIYTVGIIVLIVLLLVFTLIAGFLAAVVGRGDVVLAAAATGVTIVALSAITTPFYTALGLAVYGDLTARKDGTDLEQRIAATA